MGAVRELAERLIEIPGAVAVTLGGSRAGGVLCVGFRRVAAVAAAEPPRHQGLLLYRRRVDRCEPDRCSPQRSSGSSGCEKMDPRWRSSTAKRSASGLAWPSFHDAEVY